MDRQGDDEISSFSRANGNTPNSNLQLKNTIHGIMNITEKTYETYYLKSVTFGFSVTGRPISS
jgi:hypothetical protein